MVNAADGAFGVHRRFILVDEEGEDFTADDAADGEVDKTTASGEAVGGEEEVGRATTAGGEAVGEGEVVGQNRYLTKALSTAIAIIAFNS